MSVSKFFKEAIAYRLGGGHLADHVAMKVATYATNPLTGGSPIGLSAQNGAVLNGSSLNYPLRKWSAALGKMRNSSHNAKLLIFGDSTTAGYGATGAVGYLSGGRAKNMPVRLAAEMNRSYEPANAHAIWGDNAITAAVLPTFDSRIVIGSGWSVTNLTSIGGSSFSASSATASLAFTPSATGCYSASIDTFVVWYAQVPGSGTFNWAIDAGGTTSVPTAGTASVQSVVIPAGSLAGHTLNLNYVSGSAFYILGIQAYDSTVKQVEVWQAGYSAGTTAQFISTGQPWYMQQVVPTLAPDLTIINLQINDVNTGVSLATYLANIQTIITYCLQSGDVILRSGYPTGISVSANTALANQQLYRDGLAALAATNGIPFDDLFGRTNSAEIQQAVPGGAMYVSDLIHPTGNLYAESAYSMLNLLRNW